MSFLALSVLKVRELINKTNVISLGTVQNLAPRFKCWNLNLFSDITKEVGNSIWWGQPPPINVWQSSQPNHILIFLDSMSYKFTQKMCKHYLVKHSVLVYGLENCMGTESTDANGDDIGKSFKINAIEVNSIAGILVR